MSAAKRSRERQKDARAASPPPASKRIKTAKDAHVPSRHGLDFLVDEDERDGRRLEAKLTNAKAVTKAARVDESRTVVAPDVRDQELASQQLTGDIESAVEITSGEESEYVSDDDVEIVDAPKVNGVVHDVPMTNGHKSDDGENSVQEEVQAKGGAQDGDHVMQNGEPEPEAEQEEPSFGELLAARHPDAIDVQASYPNPDQHALVPTAESGALSAPSGATLRTVLTQALKTNDKELLERCFQTTDQNDIRATIERLQSQHVATLLQRLAERIYKRPGRTGILTNWIQWSMVAHGAYLATQPDVIRKLRSLTQVLRERANGLQPLLRLKGKLDMLSAQLELRQKMQAASRAAYGDDEDDEEGVVYVEGQDEDEDTDEEAEAKAETTAKSRWQPGVAKWLGQTATPKSDLDESSDGGESDDAMPNGVHQEGEDEDSEAEAENNGLIDVEAEESDDDEDVEEEDSNESAESDQEIDGISDVSDDESDAGVRPVNPATLNRKR